MHIQHAMGTDTVCSNCKEFYKGSKEKVPLLLRCGCTYCTQCLHRLSVSIRPKSIKCPICAMITSIDEKFKIEEQLPPNYYVLGLVVAEELGLTKIPHHGNLWKSWLQNDISAILDLPPVPQPSEPFYDWLCEECANVATLRCVQCSGNYCSPCYKTVHGSSQALRRHTHIPVTQTISTLEYCHSHPLQSKRHYCVEDNSFVCLECSLSGEHLGHEILSVSEAAKQFRSELAPLVHDAEKVLRNTRKSSEAIRRVLQQLKTNAQQQMKSLSLLMPTLYSTLQMREGALLDELAVFFDSYIQPFIQAQHFLEGGKTIVAALIKRSRDAVSDDFKLTKEAKELFRDLKEIDKFPASLEVESIADIRLSVDAEALIERIGKLGEVISDNMKSPTLLSLSGEPVDYLSTATALLPSTSLRPLTKNHSKSESPRIRTLTGNGCVNGHAIRSVSPYLKQLLSNTNSPPNISNQPLLENSSCAKTKPAHNSHGAYQRPSSFQCLSPSALESLIKVHVSHVVDPDEVYVQEVDKSQMLECLQHDINCYCRENFALIPMDQLREGMQCAAQFSEDNVWYRAVLNDVSEDNSTVTVHYIDFGNCEIIPLSRLCSLPPSIRIAPPLASRCHLHRLQPAMKGSEFAPSVWKGAAVEIVQEGMRGVAYMEVFERTPMGELYIDLFIGSSHKSLRDRLLIGKYASVSKANHIVTVHPPFSLAKGDQLSVIIVTAQSPTDFYVVDASPNCQQEFEQLEDKLERAHSCGELRVLGTPVVGMLACTRFSEDGKWYRCKIISVEEDGVGVHYIDYGNCEMVSLDEVYHIPHDVMSIPEQAVHCRLYNIAPPLGKATPFEEVTWPEDSSDYFHELVGGMDNMTMTVKEEVKNKGDPLPVQLNLEDTGEDVSEKLVVGGKADFITATPTNEPSTSSVSQTSSSPVTQTSSPVTQTSSPVTQISSPVTQINSPVTQTSSSVIQTSTAASQTCLPIIQTFSSLITSSAVSPSVHTTHKLEPHPVLSKTILSVTDPHLTGQSEPHLPTLTGQYLTSSHLTESDGLILQHQESASSKKIIISPSLPSVGTTFNCRVVLVHSLNHFYVVRVQGKGTGLEAVNQEIAKFIVQEEPMQELEPGDPALAKYGEEWHRVVYEGKGSTPNSFLVNYVDFGNHDEVESLAPIPPGLCLIPRQAIPCMLVGDCKATGLGRGVVGVRTEEDVVTQEFCMKVFQRTLKAEVKEICTNGVLVVSLNFNEDTLCEE